MILKEENGKVVYSDGETFEQAMLEIAEKYPGDKAAEFIAQDSHYSINNTFSAVRWNLLNWYPFRENADILDVGAGMGSMTGLLCRKGRSVTALEMNDARANVIRARYAEAKNLTVINENINTWNTDQKFDYVVVVGAMEYAAIFDHSEHPHVRFLESAKKFLKPDGIILLAIENQYGLKYWLGGAEDHHQKPFVGINGYTTPHTARTFSKKGLEDLFSAAGFAQQRFYYVLPDYKFPTAVFTDEWMPNKRDIDNIRFTYSANTLLTADQKRVYADVIDNNNFPFFADSYLVEATPAELPKYHVVHASLRSEVYPQYRIATVLDSEKKVKKMAVSEPAVAHIRQTYEIGQTLLARGVRHLEQEWNGTDIVTAVVEKPLASQVLGKAIQEGNIALADEIIGKMQDALIKSSETAQTLNLIFEGIQPQDAGRILQHGYIDMTYDNAFWCDGELVFFDQEWCFDGLPLQFMLYYGLKQIYKQLKSVPRYSFSAVLKKLDIEEKLSAQFDAVEGKMWANILTREGDLYGADGYCNIDTPHIRLNTKLETLEKERNDLQANERNLQGQCDSLQESKQKLQEQYDALQENNNNLQAQCAQLRTRMRNYEELETKARELDWIKDSRSWKMMLHVWHARDVLLPKGSRRRELLKKSVKAVRHPVRTLRQRGNAAPSAAQEENSFLKPVRPESEYTKLQVPQTDQPLVSIVIPVYNQFQYTYDCIRSILDTCAGIPVEIIVADDCSTDLTKKIQRLIEGVVVVRNKENLRFLLNCNHAAQQARGKYIVFLNNDTEVQPHWLQSLLELIEKDDTIGMVGSKLVYPNGKLQEAGGIVFADGSGWNYGRMQDPKAPEYNYVKEADYISGASILIRADLWRQLGGFDERFAPAYYEDTDLAFSVRKAGYRVVYQPLSEVIHFEGISNGTDTSSGQKAYQVVNAKKFLEKWQDVLQKGQCAGPQELFLARDRSQARHRMLMVDHYVPMFDKDAGSRAVFSYIRLFLKKGYHITFIGDNFFPHQPYTSVLQQMGVEVLYGDYYFLNKESWLRENSHWFEYAFLNRPHIACHYIDIIRETSDAKILYFGHDLCFLREKREYEVTGDPKFLESSENWKKQELELMRKADVSYYPSCVEEQIVHEIDPSIKVRAVPLYQYDNIVEKPYGYDLRRDLMFIGGYNHRPNVDAAKWFAAEIMPKIVEKLPDIRVHLMGSNAPDEIVALANEHILFEGAVSDEELANFYNTCRISVVPLRYGAGIKGKVLEAMSLGMPVMTTHIGAEGIAGAENILCIADDAQEFADKLVALYQDGEDLARRSAESFAYIKQNFSTENVARIVGQDFDMG